MKSPGQIGYEAKILYLKRCNPDKPWPKSWADLDNEERASNEEFAKGVIESQPCVHPWASITFDFAEGGKPIKANCGGCGSRFWR